MSTNGKIVKHQAFARLYRGNIAKDTVDRSMGLCIIFECTFIEDIGGHRGFHNAPIAQPSKADPLPIVYPGQTVLLSRRLNVDGRRR